MLGTHTRISLRLQLLHSGDSKDIYMTEMSSETGADGHDPAVQPNLAAGERTWRV